MISPSISEEKSPPIAVPPAFPTLTQTRTLLAGRLAVISFYMGLVVFYHTQYLLRTDLLSPSLAIASIAFGLSIVYSIALAFVKRLTLFILIQAALDILIVSAIILYTGGAHSPFTFLYLFIIIAVSILLSLRTVYFLTAISAAIHIGMLALEYTAVISPAYLFLGIVSNPTLGYFLFTGFINVSAMYLVAFLTGYLSDKLRKSSEKLQKASEDFTALQAFHENVMRNMGSGLITTDLNGTILSINPAALAILRIPKTFLLRSDAGTILQSKGLSDYCKALVAEKSYPARQITWTYRSPDGEEADLTMTVSAYRASDHLQGVIGVFHDVSDVKAMERRLSYAERMASVGRMSANIAHEIRNPLASLSGSIQILSGELAPLLDDDGKRLFGITNREVHRLNRIVTRFLEYASPAKSVITVTNISNVISETLLLFKALPETRSSVLLEEQIDDNLFTKVDTERFREVLWNLLQNALDAIGGKGTITITATAINGPLDPPSSDPSFAVVSVADTGPGIPISQFDQIFEPFFTTKPGGTGFGLASAYKNVQNMGGEISVSSKENAGATFTIRLPLDQ
jgi:two-component system sensor histidine kinase PilS (NtrC family)